MTLGVRSDSDSEIGSIYPQGGQRPVYLDCNATTPVDPRVADEVLTYMAYEFGNAGSRTHEYGQVAKARVTQAREELASVVGCEPAEVLFTSGATESDNMALLGLAATGERIGKKHIVATQIEHKAVLEPLEALQRRGFEITLVAPTGGGFVEPEAIRGAVRPDTLLVSVMGVNNETGVIQPIDAVAEVLQEHEAYFHVDAAQAFGKIIEPLRSRRIDLISVSGHKIFAPKGVGALVVRRRRRHRVPLEPIMFGGGQERGLRPGTLPVALIAGLGTASALALREHSTRAERAAEIKREALLALDPLGIVLNGDNSRTVPHTLNFSVPGVDSEAALVALKDVVAISNGSACTSQSYDPSHVLVAAGLPRRQIDGALRLSWSHLTGDVPWDDLVARLESIRHDRR